MESLKEAPVRNSFRAVQDAYFNRAEVKKYAWQTGHDFFSATEKGLLPEIPEHAASLLEIGCGEGGNLKLLGKYPPLTVGVDLYPEKVQFAKKEIPTASFFAADGFHLPFASGVFDYVFLRDVLHHVENPEAVLKEAWRVVRAGGRLAVLEPNGRNFLLRLFSFLVPAERLSAKNSPEKLQGWLCAISGESCINMKTLQPFPFYRVLFHYRYGLPRLVEIPGVPALTAAVERLLARIIPPSAWFYIRGEMIKST